MRSLRPERSTCRFVACASVVVVIALSLVGGCAEQSIFLQSDASPPDIPLVDASADRMDSAQGAPLGGPCRSDVDCVSRMCLSGTCSDHCSRDADCLGGHGWTCLPASSGPFANWCSCGPRAGEVCNGIDDDCDGVVDEGALCSAAQRCVGGTCVSSRCPSGQAECGGACVDLQSDPNHCGSCLTVCPAQECNAGVCGCRPGHSLCVSGCTDLQSDVYNCGTCAHRCTAGWACSGGHCVCPAGQTACGTTCVSLDSNSSHCGGCGRTCPVASECHAGVCQCPATLPVVCARTCVDPLRDRNHCGGCDVQCVRGAECVAGHCACPDNVPDLCTTATGRYCADLQNDDTNCGACENHCSAQCFRAACIRAVGIAAGPRFFCAVVLDGRVICLGNGNAGQLGDGTFGSDSTGHLVSGITDALVVVAGNGFACALRNGGRVACWGQNNRGQLGNGTRIDSGVPVPVTGLSGIVHITAGDGHVCARRNDGTLWCWGRNDGEQLGQGDVADRLAPTRVPLPAASDVHAGAAHTCAVIDSVPYCWGTNDFAQLGRGTYTAHESPGPVMFGGSVLSVTTGARHSCLLASNGTVACWGDGRWGASGDVSEFFGTPLPTIIPGLSGVSWIRTGPYSNCVSVAGQFRCWGRNDVRQLAADSTAIRIPAPVRVTDQVITDASLAEQYACAITYGRAVCSGQAPYGTATWSASFRF